jgi:hypothetical protein
MGLVVPPVFKTNVFAEAKKRRMPVQVLIRIAVEQYLREDARREKAQTDSVSEK